MSVKAIGNPPFIEKLVVNKIFWLFVCLFFFGYPLYRSMNRVLPQSLEPLYKISEYSLIDENGNNFGSKELKGKPYIASFFFTSCPTVCPELMQVMQQVQKRVRGLGDKVALVSFTVDPEQDRPEVLFKKARELQANHYIWKFLTGEPTLVKNVLIENFKVPMGDRDKISEDVWDIAHSQKLVLVDQEGGVLGYYSSTDKKSIDQLMIDLGILMNRHRLRFKKGVNDGRK